MGGRRFTFIDSVSACSYFTSLLELVCFGEQPVFSLLEPNSSLAFPGKLFFSYSTVAVRNRVMAESLLTILTLMVS